MIRPRRTYGARSGITLTEILISIMILGVGLVSVATLFPIGLVRLQKAQRLTRGGLLVESAQNDLGTRNLFAKLSFLSPPASAFYTTDPWLQDTPTAGGPPGPFGPGSNGAIRLVGPGLPVAYDPLWRNETAYTGTNALASGIGVLPDPTGGAVEARFGSGIGFIRPDPNGGGSGIPSVHGLQRITNLLPNLPLPAALPFPLVKTARETFVSPEDIVYQNANIVDALGNSITSSPVVPADVITNNGPTNDWRYTWFFTGQQSDVSNGTIFDGDVVICENRPLALDSLPSPFGGAIGFGGGPPLYPAGETTVEAVYGWTSTPDSKATGAAVGFPAGVGYGSPAARRTVLIRWPASMPDPDIRVGSWIADTTYERVNPLAVARFPSVYQPQRCNWYQIAKRTEPDTARPFSTDPVPYRSMTVWVNTPLRALTPLRFAGVATEPFHVEAVLIMPSVVNVYPRTVFTR